VLTAAQLDELARGCRDELGSDVYERPYTTGQAATDETIMTTVRSAVERSDPALR